MTTQYRLREDAAEFERAADRLTERIEDAERQIVDLRRQRGDARFHRAEALAAAQALDGIGFRVWRDDGGLVNVAVDPVPVATDSEAPE